MVRSALVPRQWLAYGVFGLPLAMAALPVYVHVPHLYASAGVDLAVLGMLLLAARLLDAGMDPLLGWWSDRAPERRQLILLALPFLGLGMLGLLHPQESRTTLWLLLALLATYFGFSLASIAYQAWGADLGSGSAERTVLTASREGFGLLGVVLASILPLVLAADSATGMSLFSWLFLPLLLIASALTMIGTPIGRPAGVAYATARVAGPSAGLGALRLAFADRRFRRLLAVFAINGIAAALPATLVLFFVADVLEAEAWGGVFLALYFVAGMVGLPLWVSISRRIGRVRTWILAMALACAAFAGAISLGSGDVWPFALVCLASGLALGADLALPPAMLADIAESQEATTGPGGYFGWWNLVAKLNLALAAGISLPLLEAFDYRPGGGDGLVALAMVYCLLPVLFKSIAAALVWNWRNDLEAMS